MPNDIIGACARNMLGLCASVLESWQLVSCIRYIVTIVPPFVASAVEARGHLRSEFICINSMQWSAWRITNPHCDIGGENSDPDSTYTKRCKMMLTSICTTFSVKRVQVIIDLFSRAQDLKCATGVQVK